MDLTFQDKQRVPALHMTKFSGINNIDKTFRIEPDEDNNTFTFPLVEANNVLIDNTLSIETRPGRELSISGEDIHSLWSDGNKCFFVDGDKLYQIYQVYPTLGARLVRSGLVSGARMSYAVFNDRVYYTNNYNKGYVRNFVDVSFSDPDIKFKRSLPAGKFIEYYKGCLYVAVGSSIYISDPLCDYFDTRMGYRRFASNITMLRAVDTGIYVADIRTYFMRGDSNEDFERAEVYSTGAVPYTDIRTPGDDLNNPKVGNVAIWTSEDGICIGDNSGVVDNVTRLKYALNATSTGAAYIRKVNEVKHYVNSLY